MSDIEPLTPAEVARRREEYQKMSNAERAAAWGVDVTDTPAIVLPHRQWASGNLDQVQAAKLAHLGVTAEGIRRVREELGG